MTSFLSLSEMTVGFILSTWSPHITPRNIMLAFFRHSDGGVRVRNNVSQKEERLDEYENRTAIKHPEWRTF